MSVDTSIEVIETALWPQGDARDPLGTWGARLIVAGDATGGRISVVIQIPQARRRSRVYTCYHAMTVQTSGASLSGTFVNLRLLTNWPDVDPVQDGVQGFATYREVPLGTDGTFNFPVAGPTAPLIDPQDRFILLFDPGVVSAGTAMDIVAIQRNANLNNANFSFEAYGYYWDRSILDTPGGPRHPGSA